MLVPRFTKERILQVRTKADASLRYFCELLGAKDLDDGVHLELCLALQSNDWRRFLLCMFRGSFKTTILQCFVLWSTLKQIDTNVLWVMSKEDNAVEKNGEMQAMVKANALFLEAYKDRIPAGFIGWNAGGFTWVRTSATAHRSFRCAGLESRLESIHADLIVCDDLEGADAETSDAPNRASERFVEDRAIPLLRNRKTSRLLVTGTPHGPAPLVHKLKTRWANRPGHRVFWVAIGDENRKPTIPSIADEAVIDEIEENAQRSPLARRMADQQFWLLPGSHDGGGFDMAIIRQFFYEKPNPFLIRYPALDLTRTVTASGGREVVTVQKSIEISSLKFFIHGDPAHLGPGEHTSKTAPSEAAIVVVGIDPDFHAFVMDTWIKQASFDQYLLAYVDLYCKWRAWTAPTHEAVGAQAWFRPTLKLLEETRFRRYIGPPQPWDQTRPWLAKLSDRLVDAKKGTTSKETDITQSLEVWFYTGQLHLHKDQAGLLAHLARFPNPDEPYDGADALAQGPKVWTPPLSADYQARMKRRAALLERLHYVEPITGYRRPWVDGSVAQNIPMDGRTTTPP